MYGKAPEEGFVIDDQKNVLPLLRGCVSIALTYFSLGNHESILCDADWEKIRETGVVVLDNEWKRHGDLVIGGLTSHYVLDARAYRATHPSDDPYHRRSKLSAENWRQEKWTPIKEPNLSWIEPVPDGYTVLLSHHPEYFPRLQNVDLVLSAHAHGGQWRFFGRGFFAPNQGWLPKYKKGLYAGRLVVTAGLKNTADVPRLFNPTELVYINLTGQE